jgi:hypothetical protein
VPESGAEQRAFSLHVAVVAGSKAAQTEVYATWLRQKSDEVWDVGIFTEKPQAVGGIPKIIRRGLDG